MNRKGRTVVVELNSDECALVARALVALIQREGETPAARGVLDRFTTIEPSEQSPADDLYERRFRAYQKRFWDLALGRSVPRRPFSRKRRTR